MPSSKSRYTKTNPNQNQTLRWLKSRKSQTRNKLPRRQRSQRTLSTSNNSLRITKSRKNWASLRSFRHWYVMAFHNSFLIQAEATWTYYTAILALILAHDRCMATKWEWIRSTARSRYSWKYTATRIWMQNRDHSSWRASTSSFDHSMRVSSRLTLQ